MTIELWILVIIIGVFGFGYAFYKMYDYGEFSGGATAFFITIALLVALIGGGHWYFNNTMSGARAMKDQQSNLNQGLMREIIIASEDGREIFYYKGKCDIETNDNYILFEDENGLRQMIYWGIQDTIIISELQE